MLDKRRVSKTEFESLGGLLSHCAHVIKGGKVFCKRVFRLYKSLIASNWRYITMTDLVKADLSWWKKLVDNFNGSKKIVNEMYHLPMVSDSSLRGFAAYMGRDWLAGTWCDRDYINVSSECSHIVSKPFTEFFEHDNINVLELWPILVGLKRWYRLVKNKSLMVFTDNTQVMYMLINGGSSNATCMNWIREIFWLCAIYNIEIIPRYINTKSNVVADTLSCLPYYTDKLIAVNMLTDSDLCCLKLLLD